MGGAAKEDNLEVKKVEATLKSPKIMRNYILFSQKYIYLNFINRSYIGIFMSLCDHKPSIMDVFKLNFEIYMKNILVL